MSTTQIAVRLPAELLAGLDELVASGAFESRAAAVRAGVESITAECARREIDRAIIDGYRRTPTTADELQAARAFLRDSIREEPW